MICPIIRGLKKQGGTLYTFSSASRDLSTHVFANSDYSFKFSHFACLNIPDIYSGGFTDEDNLLNLNAFSKDKNNPLIQVYESDSMTEALRLHIQNYMMNYEVAILNGYGDENGYDFNNPHTVSERIFFDWLQKVNAIHFEFNRDVLSEYIKYDESYFVEKCKDVPDWNYNIVSNRVVQYLGDIDVINQVELGGDSFTELYLHIPSQVGNTPNVIFKQEFDDNFSGDVNVGIEHIIGRENDFNQYGKDANGLNPFEAIYDRDVNNLYTIYDNNDAEFGHFSGLGIDWNADDYYAITNDTTDTINTIADFNSKGGNFEFNTVLIYYDLVNKTTGEKTTNLYGFMFLEEITDIKVQSNSETDSTDNTGDKVRQGYIQRYPKYKQGSKTYNDKDGTYNPTNVNGNAFGLKVNLKIDTVPDSCGVDTIVNEYNTYSMTLFADAMAKLQDANSTFYEQQNEIANIQERLDDVENIVANTVRYNALKQEVDEIRDQMNDAAVAFEKESTLLDLIAKNSQDIRKLANGELTTELQYNTDVLVGGDGINLTKQENSGKLIIERGDNSYSLNILKDITKINTTDAANDYEISKDNLFVINHVNSSAHPSLTTTLLPFTNMARVYVEPYAATNDVIIYIDDSVTHWKKGQTFRFVFNTLDLDIYRLIIRTGHDASEWRQEITFNADELGGEPIFDLICVNDNVYNDDNCFVFDIINANLKLKLSDEDLKSLELEDLDDISIEHFYNKYF